MGYAGALGALLRKELLTEWRSRDGVMTMILFSVTSLLIFNFSLDLSPIPPADVVPGILWVTFVFASLLGLNRSFQREREQGGIEGLMMAPVPRSALYLAKLIGNALYLLLIEMVALPVTVALFDLPFPPAIVPVILLGTIGISAAGTLFSAMAAHTRLRDGLLPLLLLPILIPLLVGAVRATGVLADGGSVADVGSSPYLLLVAFDVIFVTGALLLFDVVLEQ